MLTIYIVHYSMLKDRSTKLQTLLSELRYRSLWITEKDICQDITFSSRKSAFGVTHRKLLMDISNNTRSIVKSRLAARLEGWVLYGLSLWPFGRRTRWLTDRTFEPTESHKILQISEMHIEALSSFLRVSDEWMLLLEDDACFDPSSLDVFLEKFLQSKFVNSKSPVWISISSGANLGWTKSDASPDELGLFRVRPWATRCASGVLLNRQFAEVSLSLFQSFGVPNWIAIDYIYQFVMRKVRAKVYWQKIPLISQGSEDGTYPSNLKVDNE